MNFLFSTLVLSSFLIFSCSHPKFASKTNSSQVDTISNDTSVIKDVSIIALIANPLLYNHSKIRIIGYLHLEFEGTCIYIHKEDYKNAISKNALWIDLISREKMRSLQKFSDHYVIIEGIFNAGDKGHMEMNSGTVTNISRIDLWP